MSDTKEWFKYSYEEKEKIVNDFLQTLRDKLMSNNTKEVNFDLVKGITKLKMWGVEDKIYNGKETLTLRINHSGDLNEV